MKFLKSLLFISVLFASSLSLSKDDAADKKSNDPNRQGLEDGPSAISLLTEVIGPNLSQFELVSGTDRDKTDLFRVNSKKAGGRSKAQPSTTSE